MADEEKYEYPEAWITDRYGRPSIDSRALYITSVKVMGGIAIGIGFSRDEAMKALYKDLTQRNWNEARKS